MEQLNSSLQFYELCAGSISEEFLRARVPIWWMVPDRCSTSTTASTHVFSWRVKSPVPNNLALSAFLGCVDIRPGVGRRPPSTSCSCSRHRRPKAVI